MTPGYKKWNQVLFDHFFGPHNSNKVVYLYVNEDLIIKLGKKIGVSDDMAMKDFCLSVRSYTNNSEELFEKAFIWGRKWNNQGRIGIPPFISFLALTVLAAVNMRTNVELGISGGNFYHPLRELLNMSGTGMPREFDKFQKLWEYLRDWQESHNGKYGYINIFNFSTKYTSYARSQCLVRDTERAQLYEFFYWAGYKPGLQISINQMMDNLNVYLSSRAGRLSRLYTRNNSEIKRAIAETILHEYSRWSGHSKPQDGTKLTKPSYYLKQLKLFVSLETDLLAQKVNISFIALVNDEILLGENDEEMSDSTVEGFNFKNSTFKKYLHNERLNESFFFDSINNKFRLKFEGADYFVFRRGQDLGIRGWASRQDLQAGHEHLLLFLDDKKITIDAWIKNNQLEYKERKYSGTPTGWRFYSIFIPDRDIVFFDRSIKYNNEKTSLQFYGGLRVGNQEWLLDAPPLLSISSPIRSVVSINDIPAFSLVEGVDNIDVREIGINNSGAYTFSINNVSKSVILRNDRVHYIDKDNFTPVSTQAEYGELKIAGTYIYNNLENIKECFELRNGQVILTVDGVSVKKSKPSYIHGAPYDLKRKYDLLDVSFSKGTLELRNVDLFLEYLTLREQGNWNVFLNGISWCFNDDKLRLTAYDLRLKLSQLGFAEFARQGDTNEYYWRIIPTSAAFIPCAEPIVCISGGRTREMIKQWQQSGGNITDILFSYPTNDREPISVYAYSKTMEEMESFLKHLNIPYNLGEDYFGYHLAKCLPSLQSIIINGDDQIIPIGDHWKVTFWDVIRSRWSDNGPSKLKQYTSRFGELICILDKNGRKIKVDRDAGKLYLAADEKQKIFIYKNHQLRLKKEYTLPELYERSLTSCIGQCPIIEGSYKVYKNVPLEVAWSIVHKLGFELIFIN
ncbi:hypothetical protein [Paenibacillus alkalitolerans]|uniref:hypothetical protein n=1 Tax=Paenibacillus alkalitolerans TaxID=2799335 RepID=UPI0018F2DB35|nr:hypothetical protein [Paenibacillus alkalitolerans]